MNAQIRRVRKIMGGCRGQGVELSVNQETGRLKAEIPKVVSHDGAKRRAFLEEVRQWEPEILEELGFRFPGPDAVEEKVEEEREEELEWLWKERIAIGKLTLITGVAGVGKSVLAAHLAACATGGREWPGESPLARGFVARGEQHCPLTPA